MTGPTPGPWKPGQDRYLVIDMREGKPTRRKFYTIEGRNQVKKRYRWFEEFAFFTNKADRDSVLAMPDLLAACEVALPVLRKAVARSLCSADDISDRLAFDKVEAAIAKVRGKTQ